MNQSIIATLDFIRFGSGYMPGFPDPLFGETEIWTSRTGIGRKAITKKQEPRRWEELPSSWRFVFPVCFYGG
jgi:hypothetical protein